jgi:hypothetical protein
MEMKRKAVEEISKLARVYITSEKPLPDDLHGKSYYKRFVMRNYIP